MSAGKLFRLPPGTGSVLVLQLGDIGDVVLTSPSLRAIKEAVPGIRVSVLVRKGYGSLLSADPHVYEIIEVSKRGSKLAEVGRENIGLIRRLRRSGFDVLIDLRTGDRDAIISGLSGIPVRVVRHWRESPFWHGFAFSHFVDPVFTDRPVHPGGDQSLRILRAIGIDTDDTRPRLYISEETRRSARNLLARDGVERSPHIVTANPFSRWKYKEWGYGKWVELFDRLWSKWGLPAVIIGTKDEAGAASGIAGKCAGPVLNMAGKTTLGELAGLISLSRLHVGVDSAAPHIAAAVGTPAVTIFGPSNWRAWTVEDETHRIVRSGKECVPCNNKGCDGKERSICLDELGVDAVTEMIDEVLRKL